MARSSTLLFSLSRAGRLEAVKSVVPGPGSYLVKGSIGDEKSSARLSSPRDYSRRIIWEARHGTPNAGHYPQLDPEKTSKMTSSPRFSFALSRSNRLDTNRTISPGPGFYDSNC